MAKFHLKVIAVKIKRKGWDKRALEGLIWDDSKAMKLSRSHSHLMIFLDPQDLLLK